MLKKSLHIAMALLLMVSITGLTIHKHYCGDELTSVSLFEDASDCQESSCAHCEDVSVSCKIDVDILSADAQNIPENIQLEISSIELFANSLLTIFREENKVMLTNKQPDLSALHGMPMLQSFLC
ncbi:MAG: hypothetical protein L3J66_10210 [Bacteroidales bacterium]|nr:hypothetical protein [Bacteroidales bacterium]